MIVDQDVMQGPLKKARRHQKRMIKQIRKNNKQQDRAYRNATLAEKGQGPPGLGVVSGLIDTVGGVVSSFFGGGAAAAASQSISAVGEEEMSGLSGAGSYFIAPAFAVGAAVVVTALYQQNK